MRQLAHRLLTTASVGIFPAHFAKCLHPYFARQEERIFVELVALDRKLKASIEGSKGWIELMSSDRKLKASREGSK